MITTHLFDLASQHNRWLAARQAVVALNVANASTPGYRTREVNPFAETLEITRLDLVRTQDAHLSLDDDQLADVGVEESPEAETLHSQNNVSLEREFEKSGEVGRAYAFNAQIMKTFNRMLLLSSKG